jgi:Protein of unknown function (DUF3429)
MDDARPALKPQTAPVGLWAIALLALTPFLVAAYLYAYGPSDLARPGLTVLLNWSGVVLAFLGGVRWGLESAEPTPRAHRLFLAALSPAAAWTVFMARGIIPDYWILTAFLIAFLLNWMFDHRAPDIPTRYPRLSTLLTVGACTCLGIALEKSING